MIIDIRGTHGSGKSWVVHQLLNRFKGIPVPDHGKIIGYELPAVDGMVVGKYDSTCGGCDGIKTPEEVEDRVSTFRQFYTHVILEGILVSHTYERYHKLAESFKLLSGKDDYYFCFLDTPLELCIARVKARRFVQGNEKEFNPKNLIKDYDVIWNRVQKKCRDAGHNVVVLNHKDPIPQLLEMLEK
jgi:thymidylate kinase